MAVLERCPNLLSAADLEPKAYADKLCYDLKFGKASQTAKVRGLCLHSCTCQP